MSEKREKCYIINGHRGSIIQQTLVFLDEDKAREFGESLEDKGYEDVTMFVSELVR